jgi:two-component system invasion response regulator UvrY
MEIGADLHLSPKTVDSYRSRLMAKLGVRDVQGLVRFAVRTGLISADEL